MFFSIRGQRSQADFFVLIPNFLEARFWPINLSILWPYSSTVVCVRAPLTKQGGTSDTFPAGQRVSEQHQC